MPPFDQKKRGRSFLPCGTIAGNRARRQVAQRRLPKSTTPLITVAVFVGLILSRLQQTFAARFYELWLYRHGKANQDYPSGFGFMTQAPAPSKTTVTTAGQIESEYRPPSNYQPKHLAQIIASLIRNRGKFDNAAIKEKWRHLDQFALPIAIYLRDIEADGMWDELEREIDSIRLIANRQSGLLSSKRHHNILILLPSWSERGRELLAAERALETKSEMSVVRDFGTTGGLS